MTNRAKISEKRETKLDSSAFGYRFSFLVFRVLLLALLLSPIVRGSSLTFTGVFPRIFTPNADGFNDKAAFHFENPEMLPVAGKIYDIAGAEVGSLIPGTDPTSTLLWDGKDSNGRIVPGGIYFFKIDFQGEIITGSVVVAR